jgi:hypothetical protein
VEGVVPEEEFLAVVAKSCEPKLIPFISYCHRRSEIHVSGDLVIGKKLASNTLQTNVISALLPAEPLIDSKADKSDAGGSWDDIHDHAKRYGYIGDSYGTIGSLLTVTFDRQTKINVVQTAAHVPFDNLNMADLIDGKLATFNSDIKYAHYTQSIDVCILPVSSSQC